MPGRVVIPGSAGVPPAQDLAGSWRLASQGWSVHLPTGAGAAPLQECGRDARAPRGKPMAGQVQIRILQKAQFINQFLGVHSWFFVSIRGFLFFGPWWITPQLVSGKARPVNEGMPFFVSYPALRWAMRVIHPAGTGSPGRAVGRWPVEEPGADRSAGVDPSGRNRP